MFSTSIDTFQGPLELTLESNSITLVVGPNGVGKSALLQDIYRRLPINVTSYYPGHRQITFSHGWENMQMSLSDLDSNLFAQTEGFNRFKSVWPEEQFKAVLRRLQNSENAYNQDIISRIRNGEHHKPLVDQLSSPMQILNTVFRNARLSVQFKLTESGLTAVRSGRQYGIDRLSDGERAALFIIAAIVNQPEAGVIIIDEPERHLHPSISAPLISSAVRARPHLSFVFATHDLNLIDTLSVDQTLYIRDSNVISDRPEKRVYDIRRINGLETIPQDLKRDILGVRDKVLFVEGTSNSLDMPIYSACFANWKIAPRGGHDKVQEAVRALNDNSDLHWMQAIGIIDGDGRDSSEVFELHLSKIIALPVPSIENLFFIREVVEQICEIFEGVDGVSASERLIRLDGNIANLVSSNLSEIVHKRTVWIANRRLSSMKVSLVEIREGKSTIDPVDLNNIKENVLKEINAFLALPPKLDDIEHLPIKATGIPAKISELAGASSLKKYKQTVLHQLEINSVHGQKMKAAILSRLPVLP